MSLKKEAHDERREAKSGGRSRSPNKAMRILAEMGGWGEEEEGLCPRIRDALRERRSGEEAGNGRG